MADTYHGGVCRHCGGTLRYSVSRQCVKRFQHADMKAYQARKPKRVVAGRAPLLSIASEAEISNLAGQFVLLRWHQEGRHGVN